MDGCLFCKIAGKKIPAKLVAEDEHLVAFEDIQPQAPVHILIVPRKHVPTMLDITDEDRVWWDRIPAFAREIAGRKKVGAFRLVLNCGEDAGQSVFHLHFHMLAGRKMAWPPG